MTEQEIKDLKKSVELQERNHKLRKRKPKLKTPLNRQNLPHQITLIYLIRYPRAS